MPSPSSPEAPFSEVAEQVRALLTQPLPLPGHGDTAGRWDALLRAARTDVVVGRLLEAHADADAILAELTGTRAGLGQWWGVWAAEPPAPAVAAHRTSGGWLLSGTKAWCSGAGLCTHALVTVRRGDERPLVAVDLSHPGVSLDLSGWVAAGMSRSATGAVSFDRVPAERVGEPAAYLQRPGFWHGGAGVAACWLGGAERVADTLRRVGPRLDEHGAAHLGAVDAALAGARWSLLAAAAEVDARPEDVDAARIRTARVRAVVEAAAAQTVDRVGRALGAAPLATGRSHTGAVSDLLLYLRQSHAERDLAALGRLVAASSDADAPVAGAAWAAKTGGMAKDLSDAGNRNRLKDESFALPDERKYPIPDIEHARNVLARVAQNGSAEEQKKVRAAVEKRYPSLKKDD